MILDRAVLGALIGNVVGHIDPTHFHFEPSRIIRVRGKHVSDAWKNAALQPRGGTSFGVGSSLHVHAGDAVIVIEVQIVFAAPSHFDGLTDFLRKKRGFGHVIRFRFSSETSAQKRDMAGDIFFVYSKCFRYDVLCGLRILHRGVSQHFAILEFGYRGGRFHGCVGEQRYVVRRFVNFGSARELSIHVARIAHHFAGLAGGIQQLLFVGFRFVGCVGTEIPFDLQLLAGLHRGPGIIGDHRNTT